MSTSIDRKEDGKNYNCSQETLAEEGYYLINTFNDTIYEKQANCEREILLQFMEEGKNNDYLSQYAEKQLMESPDYLDFIKKMKQAIQTARNMRKSWLKNKTDYEDFKHDKELIGLKYETIRARVNFIQISVIVVSTIITFLETIKEKVGIANSISMTIAPIILSTYIGLALAISRFFKLDDRKEELCKLDETMAFCMSGLRHRMRDIDRMKPLTAEQTMEAILQCDQMLDDQNKDGLEETIGGCKQKLDLAINLSEKVKYKNMLLKINLNKYIAEDNKKNLKEHRNQLSLYTYKSDVCCLWKYLCCDFNTCRREFIDVESAYADAEAFETGKDNNYRGRHHKKRRHYHKHNNSDKEKSEQKPPLQLFKVSSKEEPVGPNVSFNINDNINDNINTNNNTVIIDNNNLTTGRFSHDYVGLASHMSCSLPDRRSSVILQELNKINKKKEPLETVAENIVATVLEEGSENVINNKIIPKDTSSV